MVKIPALLTGIATIYPPAAVYMKCINFKHLPDRSAVNGKDEDGCAIIATGVKPELLDEDERIVYGTIVRRMFEAFAPRCKKELITVDADVCGLLFRFQKCSTVSADRKAITGDSKSDLDGTESDEGELSEIAKGTTLNIAGYGIGKYHTMPESLYTEATLLDFLENIDCNARSRKQPNRSRTSIGTAAVRAQVVADLFERGYIERSGEAIIPTDKGSALYGKVKNLRIADMDIAAEHEKLLACVERGEVAPDDFMKTIEKHTEQAVKEIEIK